MVGESLNKKYCKQCNINWDNPDYKFCPKCASPLVDIVIERVLRIFNRFSHYKISKCGYCDEYFPDEYKFCPKCKAELTCENVFNLNEDKREITSFNGDSVGFDEIYEHYYEYNYSCGSFPEHLFFADTLMYINQHFSYDENNECMVCDRHFDGSFKYCPMCANRLFSEYDARYLKRYINHKVARCPGCGKEFHADFKFCPICAQKLEVEDIFRIDFEKDLIFGKWNEGEVSIPIDDACDEIGVMYTPPKSNFFELFFVKGEYDAMLEKAFDGLEKPSKLTFDEVKELDSLFSFVSYFGRVQPLGLMNLEMIESNFEESLNDLISKHQVVKLRKDLFLAFSNPPRDVDFREVIH